MKPVTKTRIKAAGRVRVRLHDDYSNDGQPIWLAITKKQAQLVLAMLAENPPLEEYDSRDRDTLLLVPNPAKPGLSTG
jgi:hypothetical protein